MPTPRTAFFAYPSRPPSSGEAMREAVTQLNHSSEVQITSWEDLRIGGKFIMEEICKHIASSDIFCADLTASNPNVLFELGFAIARDKRIWLILDETYLDSKRTFNDLRLLTTVGYRPYCNAHDIVGAFFTDHPYDDVEDTVFSTSLKPRFSSDEPYTLLYLKSRHETQLSIRVTNRVAKSGLPVTVDDPKESGTQTLAWYAQKLYVSLGVLTHFSNSARQGSALANARYSFVAGLAHGLQKPLLMLTDDDQLAPLDYRDLARNCQTSHDCDRELSNWLPAIQRNFEEARQSKSGSYFAAIRLQTELRRLVLGDPIAENESRELPDYFLETAAFNEALTPKTVLMIGRKGSGKSATLIDLAAQLGSDRRNLVCAIRPVAYEMEGILNLFQRYRERHGRAFLTESLWKFLIYSELAQVAATTIEKREGAPPTDVEAKFLGLMDRDAGLLRADFAVRLERAVKGLGDLGESAGIEDERRSISEALHEGLLGELRTELRALLSEKERVVVLVDNLDKGWDRHTDIAVLSELLLGLLSAAPRITAEFGKAGRQGQSVNLELKVFLRSDIFSQIRAVAREPDKIRSSRLVWNDRQLLVRVIEERFAAKSEQDGASVWTQFFCKDIDGVPTSTYLMRAVLPRPRDMIFLVNAAIACAVDRKHTRVERTDIEYAEVQYSQFAKDSILVENGVTVAEMDAILLGFAGSRRIVAMADVEGVLLAAGIDRDRHQRVVDHLCELSFLGVEVSKNKFSYAADDEDFKKLKSIAAKVTSRYRIPPRFEINGPFRRYLEIEN